MEFDFGVLSDVGIRRTKNQDLALAKPELGLFIVADGMGGHKGGETASKMAVEIISRSIQELEQQKVEAPAIDLITDAISKANISIFARSAVDPQLAGMGTTITVLYFKNGQLTVAQVGDSRCYMLRDSGLWQVTKDHSLVQEKLRAGLITREQVKVDKMRNVITRCVGFEENVYIDFYTRDLHPDDCFLICSDGLTSSLEDQSMLDYINVQFSINQGNLQEVTRQIIDEANRVGGDDNITVLLVRPRS